MKLKENVNIVEFIRQVSLCASDVWLVSGEDRLNLKSLLSQYAFALLRDQPDWLAEARVVCGEEDRLLLADYIEAA